MGEMQRGRLGKEVFIKTPPGDQLFYSLKLPHVKGS